MNELFLTLHTIYGLLHNNVIRQYYGLVHNSDDINGDDNDINDDDDDNSNNVDNDDDDNEDENDDDNNIFIHALNRKYSNNGKIYIKN